MIFLFPEDTVIKATSEAKSFGLAWRRRFQDGDSLKNIFRSKAEIDGLTHPHIHFKNNDNDLFNPSNNALGRYHIFILPRRN